MRGELEKSGGSLVPLHTQSLSHHLTTDAASDTIGQWHGMGIARETWHTSCRGEYPNDIIGMGVGEKHLQISEGPGTRAHNFLPPHKAPKYAQFISRLI